MMKTIDISDASIAEVVRGLMSVATIKEKGLMPAGVFEMKNGIYLNPQESYNFGEINGALGIRNIHSWAGYELYWCSGGSVINIAVAPYTLPHTITYVDGDYILSNVASNRRLFQIFFQNIPF